MRLPWVWQSNFRGHRWLMLPCRWGACSDSMASFWCTCMTLSVREEGLMLGGRLHEEPWPELQPSSSTQQESISGWLCWGDTVLYLPLSLLTNRHQVCWGKPHPLTPSLCCDKKKHSLFEGVKAFMLSHKCKQWCHFLMFFLGVGMIGHCVF